ncbi:MAG: hypothetical protein ABID54_08780, partial [Pseudomonadota bacterium]
MNNTIITSPRLGSCYLFLILSFVTLVMSCSYLWVNIEIIPDRVTHIAGQKGDDNYPRTHPRVNTTEIGLFGKKVQEVKGFLEKISVDLSAVTPLILVLFSGSILRSSWKLIKYREFFTIARSDESFPLPRNHKMTWIQLGFIGTLWGFLIIGWRMEQAKSGMGAEIVDILIKAFGTALLSTFTAVVMVYIVGPVFRWFYRWATAAV